MSTVYLSLGSNIRPQKNIPACVKLLSQEFKIKKISSIYETAPVGPAGTKKFWNLIAALSWRGGKKILTQKLRGIEKKLGRVRDPKNRFRPRTIDIDILPQKGYEKFAFIMIPLAEIAPKYTARAKALHKEDHVFRIRGRAAGNIGRT